MEGTPVEYIIRQKNEGPALWLKIGLLVLYPAVFAILAALILTYMAPLLHIPFLLLLFAFIVILPLEFQFPKDTGLVVLFTSVSPAARNYARCRVDTQ